MTPFAWRVATIALALASVTACQRNEPITTAPAPTAAPAVTPPPAPIATPAATAAAESSTAGAADRAPTVELSLPLTVAIGKSGEISFTIADVTIEPRNPESVRVVLLVRMQNQQRQAATFADENFRLVTQDSVIPAKGGLNQTVEAQTDSKLERVQFTVPLGAVSRAVKIEHGGEAAEVPLALKW